MQLAHILKVSVLLVIVVVAMRLASWFLGWLFRRLLRIDPSIAAIASNIAAFAAFVAWLHKNAIYGGMEWNAVVFGAVVWCTCLLIDITAIRRKRRKTATAAAKD